MAISALAGGMAGGYLRHMEELSAAIPLTPHIGVPEGNYTITMEFENQLVSRGYGRVAGIDEAGRGPLAGPVVAAAVILDHDNIPEGLKDSKTLNATKRIHLFRQIVKTSHVGIAWVNAQTIDQINIRKATLNCMTNAANALEFTADWHLIDGRDIPPGLAGRSSAVIKGDGRSASVAAASIIAKVTRDNIMIEVANSWPQYRFEKHKGYGTKTHLNAIKQYGPCPFHRKSFSPIREFTESKRASKD